MARSTGTTAWDACVKRWRMDGRWMSKAEGGLTAVDWAVQTMAVGMARRRVGRRALAASAGLLGISLFDPGTVHAACNTCYSDYCSNCFATTNYCYSPDGSQRLAADCTCESCCVNCRCSLFKAAITICDSGAYSAWCPGC